MKTWHRSSTETAGPRSQLLQGSKRRPRSFRGEAQTEKTQEGGDKIIGRNLEIFWMLKKKAQPSKYGIPALFGDLSKSWEEQGADIVESSGDSGAISASENSPISDKDLPPLLIPGIETSKATCLKIPNPSGL